LASAAKLAPMPPTTPSEYTLVAITSCTGAKPSWARLKISAPLSSLVTTVLGSRLSAVSAGWREAVPVINSSTTPAPKGLKSIRTSTTALAPTLAASRRSRNSAK
jgi:hypothetical protein